MTSFAKAPVGAKRPFRMRAGVSSILDLADGYLGLGAYAVGAADVYFCDGNAGNDGSDGKSWDSAFKTLAVAFAASSASIALNSKGWAARNVIFCKGDTFTEVLTTLPNKTDVIGVGSYGQHAQTGIRGIHVFSAANMGCRFINMYFDKVSATGAVDMVTVGASISGLQFLHCTFDGDGSTPATAAIVATGAAGLVIKDCVFKGLFSDAVIELVSGDFTNVVIQDNVITGGEIGIEIPAGSCSAGREPWIIGNLIHTTSVCIKDTAGIANVIQNYCMTAGAEGADGAGVIVYKAKHSLGNWGAASNKENFPIPAITALT